MNGRIPEYQRIINQIKYLKENVGVGQLGQDLGDIKMREKTGQKQKGGHVEKVDDAVRGVRFRDPGQHMAEYHQKDQDTAYVVHAVIAHRSAPLQCLIVSPPRPCGR